MPPLLPLLFSLSSHSLINHFRSGLSPPHTPPPSHMPTDPGDPCWCPPLNMVFAPHATPHTSHVYGRVWSIGGW